MARTVGDERRIMLGLFNREATYNSGTTMGSGDACEMSGFTSEPRDFADEVFDDSAEITGSEFPTTQEILRLGLSLGYNEPKAKPNTIAGLGALVLGAVTSVQDGANAAYRHDITPIAATTPLPTIRAEVMDGTQWGFDGILGQSLKISGGEDGFIAAEAQLVGSGTRSTSGAAFAPKIIESWLKTTQMKVWLENGTSISIDGTPTQNAENISSGTPDDLSVRIRSFSWDWNNNPYLNYGYGSSVLQEADKGPKRACTLTFSLQYTNDNELNSYISQETMAIEFDAQGGLIDPAGTMRYGMSLIVPAFKIKKVGLKGASGAFLTQDFECTVIDDGTNPITKLSIYNAQATYLA